MAVSPDEMVPSGPSSAGQQAVIAYLQSKGLPINAGNIRRAVEANARDPGSMEANGPNLGPTVLNLRNAGIEDASPMPVRGGGEPKTSASPTQVANDPPLIPTPTGAQPSSGAGGVPSMPPPIVGAAPNPTGQALPSAPGAPQLSGPAPIPALMGPDGVPLLGGPNDPPQITGGSGLPALGAGVAAGIPLIEMIRRSLLGGPAPAPAVGGPSPGMLQLPAPAERPPIALPSQSTGNPAIPLQDANVARPLLETPGVQLSPAPPSPASAAIDEAIKPPPVQQAPKAKIARRVRVPIPPLVRW